MNIAQFRIHVVRPTLRHLDLYSPAAENLLIGTAVHESGGLEYIDQITNSDPNNLGPAVSPYQIEDATRRDQYDNYLRYPSNEVLRGRVGSMLAVWPHHFHQLATNLAYATAIARIKYWRDAKPLPDASDLNGLAWYWKRVYNTMHGAGTPEKFISDFSHHNANDGALVWAE